jgi:hypothetical protein
MAEYSVWGRIIENLGATGLMVLVLWKLVDKWAGRFLEAQIKQASAMGEQASAMSGLCAAVRDGQGGQQELLLAVRVMATKIDEVKVSTKEIAANCAARRAPCQQG